MRILFFVAVLFYTQSAYANRTVEFNIGPLNPFSLIFLLLVVQIIMAAIVDAYEKKGDSNKLVVLLSVLESFLGGLLYIITVMYLIYFVTLEVNGHGIMSAIHRNPFMSLTILSLFGWCAYTLFRVLSKKAPD